MNGVKPPVTLFSKAFAEAASRMASRIQTVPVGTKPNPPAARHNAQKEKK